MEKPADIGGARKYPAHQTRSSADLLNPSRSVCQHHWGLVMPFLRQICVRFGTTLEMQVDDKMTINRARETPHTQHANLCFS